MVWLSVHCVEGICLSCRTQKRQIVFFDPTVASPSENKQMMHHKTRMEAENISPDFFEV